MLMHSLLIWLPTCLVNLVCNFIPDLGLQIYIYHHYQIWYVICIFCYEHSWNMKCERSVFQSLNGVHFVWWSVPYLISCMQNIIMIIMNDRYVWKMFFYLKMAWYGRIKNVKNKYFINVDRCHHTTR